MKYFYDENLKSNARSLRKSMTPWERKLWFLFLRNYSAKVYRQRIIGPYIVDFYCPKARLVIELDGSQHFMPEEQDADAVRKAALESRGCAVLRFPNADLDRHFTEVCEAIHNAIQSRIIP